MEQELVVVTPALPGTKEWSDAHVGRIGGSTVADILGLGRRTPLRAWAELTGKIPREDLSRKPWIRRGVRLEPVVKELYQDETQRVVLPSPGMIQHPRYDWLAGTPDGLLNLADGRGVAPWEAKTFGMFKSKDWVDGAVPLAYQIQVTLYMVLTGAEWASIAAMPIDDDEDAPAVLHQDMVLNPVFADHMMDKLLEFREKHWLADIPPPGDFGKDADTIKKMFPREVEGQRIELTDEIADLWLDIERRVEEHGLMGKAIEADKARVRAFMGDAELGLYGDWNLRCKVEPRKEHIVKASNPRVLRKVKA